MTRHAVPAAADSGDAQAPPGALVVGGAHVSIAVARSLGRRGIPVWLLASHPLPRTLALYPTQFSLARRRAS